jgi:hypothetical protein
MQAALGQRARFLKEFLRLQVAHRIVVQQDHPVEDRIGHFLLPPIRPWACSKAGILPCHHTMRMWSSCALDPRDDEQLWFGGSELHAQGRRRVWLKGSNMSLGRILPFESTTA